MGAKKRVYRKGHFKRMVLKHKTVSAILILGLVLAVPIHVGATAQQQKNQAQANLDKTTKEINALTEQANAVKAELSAKGQELADILVNIGLMEVDIAATEESIAQAEVDLAAAEAKAAEQYANMKLRIQFMYENSVSDSFWSAILGANGIADMLNRVEYVQQVEDADRDMLTAYEETVTQIAELKVALEEQHAQLVEMKEGYEKEQQRVEVLIAELKKEQSNYNTQIANAQALATQYKKTIAEANKKIEEERRAAEEAAKKKASGSSSSSSSNGVKVPGGSGINPAQTTSVSGQSIVNEALKYVGGPYVWGGGHVYTLSARANYNIMNGVDCSGFVSCVFSHFGIDTPTYSTSFAYSGKEVSPDCMQPGDVIVYGTKGGIGHVAIYAGNGLIVEAQSTNAGITANRRWDNRDVIAIRRYN